MKHAVLYAVLLATVASIMGCASLRENPREMIAAVKALDEQSVAAFNKRDVDAMMAIYWKSPDLVSYPMDTLEEERGWDAVKAGIKQMFATMPAGVTVEATEANYEVAGDVVIAWGRWRTKMKLPSGQTTTLDGRSTGVAAKRDGKWVYILDHLSVPYGATPKPSTTR